MANGEWRMGAVGGLHSLFAIRHSPSSRREPDVFYREAGQFKTSYAADMAVFPLRQDRIGIALIVAAAYVLSFSNDFMIQAVLIPFLVFSLAAIGLNILTGYAGLLSLGTGGFMGVGAYACYKLTTAFPGVNILVWILVSGLFSAAV